VAAQLKKWDEHLYSQVAYWEPTFLLWCLLRCGFLLWFLLWCSFLDLKSKLPPRTSNWSSSPSFSSLSWPSPSCPSGTVSPPDPHSPCWEYSPRALESFRDGDLPCFLALHSLPYNVSQGCTVCCRFGLKLAKPSNCILKWSSRLFSPNILAVGNLAGFTVGHFG
jgi:hypothetical protein